MLSDEAIAGLMLDEELAEASNSMCTPVTPVVDLPLPTFMQSWPAFLQNYTALAMHNEAAPVITDTSAVDPTSSSNHNDNGGVCDSSRVTQSLMKLDLDSSASPQDTHRRHHHPSNPQPHSLALHLDSSSDQSSPEDLTPGYAPLRDVSFSPEEFVPPPRMENTRLVQDNTVPSPTSSSSSDETHQPNHGAWFPENESTVQKKP